MVEDHKRVTLNITGRVQGVGFRHFTVTNARKLTDVGGWVRNEPDGSVKVVAEGSQKELNKLIKQVNQGPRTARVDNVRQQWGEPTGQFNTFEVRY
ncbi:MAG: acylphosphatase [bacterium]